MGVHLSRFSRHSRQCTDVPFTGALDVLVEADVEKRMPRGLTYSLLFGEDCVAGCEGAESSSSLILVVTVDEDDSLLSATVDDDSSNEGTMIGRIDCEGAFSSVGDSLSSAAVDISFGAGGGMPLVALSIAVGRSLSLLSDTCQNQSMKRIASTRLAQRRTKLRLASADGEFNSTKEKTQVSNEAMQHDLTTDGLFVERLFLASG